MATTHISLAFDGVHFVLTPSREQAPLPVAPGTVAFKNLNQWQSEAGDWEKRGNSDSYVLAELANFTGILCVSRSQIETPQLSSGGGQEERDSSDIEEEGSAIYAADHGQNREEHDSTEKPYRNPQQAGSYDCSESGTEEKVTDKNGTEGMGEDGEAGRKAANGNSVAPSGPHVIQPISEDLRVGDGCGETRRVDNIPTTVAGVARSQTSETATESPLSFLTGTMHSQKNGAEVELGSLSEHYEGDDTTIVASDSTASGSSGEKGAVENGSDQSSSVSESSADEWESSTSLPVTALHEACARPEASVDELISLLRSNPAAASTTNASGQLPLHVIAQNELLCLRSSKGDGCGEREDGSVEKFLLELIDAHPPALSVEDEDGQIPFTSVIADWIHDVHDNDNTTISPTASAGTSRSRRPATAYGVPEITSHSTDSNIDSPVVPLREEVSPHRIFPLDVGMSPMVTWSLEFLSSALARVKAAPARRASTRDSVAARLHQMSIRNAVANKIAAMPQFLKTVFLIEDDDERESILKIPLVRRVCLSSDGVGEWFLCMLKKKGYIASRAVDYFCIVSNIDMSDYLFSPRSPRKVEIDEFRLNRDEVFEALGQYQVVPSLVVLETNQIERAATTQVVQRILDKSVTRPIVLALVLIDLVLHAILMFSYRVAVSKMEFTLDENGNIRQFPHRTALILITVIGVHFLLRKLSQVVSLLVISRSVFWSFMTNLWNLMDICAIVLVLVTPALKYNYNDDDLGNLFAVTMGLLWMKLLGFLKAMNMQLATFILAIAQIMRDIRWFVLILGIAIFMFSDMVYIITVNHSGAGDCSDLSGQGEATLDLNEHCFGTVKETYIRSYAILVGDVSLDDYRETTFIVILFVVFTFLGIIVLLNVLIAIVSDSYEKSRIKCERLFGRARVEFVAEFVSLEKLVFRPVNFATEVTRRREWSQCVSRLLRWLTISSILLTAGTSDLFIVAIVFAAFTDSFESALGVLSLIFFVTSAVILNLAIVPIWIALFQDCVRSTTTLQRAQENPIVRICKEIVYAPIKVVCKRVLATTEKSMDWGTEGDFQWAGRLDYIERRTREIVSESEVRMNASMMSAVKSSEDRIRDHESKLQDELQTKLGSLTSAVWHVASDSS